MTNDSLKNQLAKKFNRKSDHFENGSLFELNLKRPFDLQGDGIDHINISLSGVTDLGRILHPSAVLDFNHEAFGRFGSISAFWDYIVTGAVDGRMRKMKTAERTALKHEIGVRHVPNLHYLLLDATWQRIKQHKGLMDAVGESTLPFDMLRFQPGLSIPRRQFNMLWYIEGLEVIRYAIQHNAGPSFSVLVNNRSRREVLDEYIREFLPNLVKREVPKENKLLESLLKEKAQTRPFVQKQSSDENEEEQSSVEDVNQEEITSSVEVEETTSVSVHEDVQENKPVEEAV